MKSKAKLTTDALLATAVVAGVTTVINNQQVHAATTDTKQVTTNASQDSLQSASQAVTDAQSSVKTAQDAVNAANQSNPAQANAKLKAAQDNFAKAQNHYNAVSEIAKTQAQTTVKDHGYHADGTKVVDQNGQVVNNWQVQPNQGTQADLTKADQALTTAKDDLTQANDQVQQAQAAYDNLKSQSNNSVLDPASYGLTITATDQAKAVANKLNQGTPWNSLSQSDLQAINDGIKVSYTPTEAQKARKVAPVDYYHMIYGFTKIINSTSPSQYIEANEFLAAIINGIRQALGLHTGKVVVNQNMLNATQDMAHAADKAFDEAPTLSHVTVNINPIAKKYGLLNPTVTTIGTSTWEIPTINYQFRHDTDQYAAAPFLSMAHVFQAITQIVPDMSTPNDARVISQLLGVDNGKLKSNDNTYIALPHKIINRGDSSNMEYLFVAAPSSITDPTKFNNAKTYGLNTQDPAKLQQAETKLTEAKQAQTKAQDAVKSAQTALDALTNDAKVISPDGIVVDPKAPITPSQPSTKPDDHQTKPSDHTDQPATDPSTKPTVDHHASSDQPSVKPSDQHQTTSDTPTTQPSEDHDVTTNTHHEEIPSQSATDIHQVPTTDPVAHHTDAVSTNTKTSQPTVSHLVEQPRQTGTTSIKSVEHDGVISDPSQLNFPSREEFKRAMIQDQKRSQTQAKTLPQTGNQDTTALVGLGLAGSLMALFGFKRRHN